MQPNKKRPQAEANKREGTLKNFPPKLPAPKPMMPQASSIIVDLEGLAGGTAPPLAVEIRNSVPMGLRRGRSGMWLSLGAACCVLGTVVLAEHWVTRVGSLANTDETAAPLAAAGVANGPAIAERAAMAKPVVSVDYRPIDALEQAPEGQQAPEAVASPDVPQGQVPTDLEPTAAAAAEEAEAEPEPATGTPEEAAAPDAPKVDARKAELQRRLRMAHRQRRARKFKAAQANYRRALALHTNYPPALAGMARTYLAMGDAQQADRWAWRAVKARPGLASYQVLHGDALRMGGHHERAEAAYERAVARGSRVARQRLGNSP